MTHFEKLSFCSGGNLWDLLDKIFSRSKKKYRNLLKSFTLLDKYFAQNLTWYPTFFSNFSIFYSLFNFWKLWLFIKILAYSNQEFENITTSANNLVLCQKHRISKGKNPKNLQKDGYVNNAWEFRISKMVHCS